MVDTESLETGSLFVWKRQVKKLAAKKIGAIIALDGEKEFKQNVASCNKSLSALKSELGLVKAECEGQANSLESLSKQHEVLTKILEEQKAKEEAVREGLKHAQDGYEKVGAGLKTLNKEQETHTQKVEELKNAYKEAEKYLQEMAKTGESSEQTIKEQKAVIQLLAEELKTEEKALKEVNSAIEKGEQNYQTAGNRIKDWETKLSTAQTQVIRTNTELNRNAAYMREAEQAADQCATSIDNFGKTIEQAEEATVDFSDVLQFNLANTVVDAVKDAAAQAADAILEIDSAQQQFQASTGATATEMQGYKTVMDDIYQNNYGESMDDIAEAMELIRQYTGEVDPTKLKETTENAIAMRDVFDMDLTETIRGVDGLVENMGITSEHAFDLMVVGAQNGLNKSGELADNLSEYTSLWGQAGFSAEEMFAILDNGLSNGAYNLDKVNDFVKEFGNSLADGRIEENLTTFSGETQDLFRQWKSGKATTKDVFYSVIKDLDKTTNKQEALTTASNIWSSLGEDNAMKVITSLNDLNNTYDDVEGAMKRINNIKYDTLEGRFQQLGRKFVSEVAKPIAEDALPLMEDGLDRVADNLDTLIPLVGGVAVGAATFKTVSAAVNAYETAVKGATVAQTVYTTATEGATVATTVLNSVSKASPFILVASAVAAAGTALLLYSENSKETSAELEALIEQNERVCDSANEVSDETEKMISSYEENAAEMEAQGEYAQILSDRIESLAGQTEGNAEKTQVLKGYIAELNELVPELNLAYDEQTGKLNMTNEELEKYLENHQKEIELQAATEHMYDLLKQRTELQTEAIKLSNEATELRIKLREEENESMERTNGMYEKYGENWREIKDAADKNSEALKNNREAQKDVNAEIEAAQEIMDSAGASIDELTDKENTNAEATQNNAETQTAAADAHISAAQTILDSYMEMQQTVSDVLDSQMNMFEEFNAGTEISSEQLLQNMQSQIDGVTNWADNMTMLGERGINHGILEKLAEMGPQSSTYVQAFANMTDEQLQDANEMWTRSIDMKEGVDSSVQGMIEQYTNSLNGGQEQIATAMENVGINVSQGLANGIRNSINEGTIAIDESGKAVINQGRATFGIQSPSKVFYEIGGYVVQGLADGITGSRSQATAALQITANQMIDMARKALATANFKSAGGTVSEGIREGILAKKPTVLNTVSDLTKSIQTKAKNELTTSKYKTIGESVSSGLASGITSKRERVESATASLIRSIESEAGNLNEYTLHSEGYYVSLGLAQGISDGRSAVINSVAQLCYDAVMTANENLEINSPSKVFKRIGQYTAEGFGVGYKEEMANVNALIRDSMDIPQARKRNGSAYRQEDRLPEKIVVELPIYTGKNYTKTEIVEIALDGINNRQRSRRRAKGVSISGV